MIQENIGIAAAICFSIVAIIVSYYSNLYLNISLFYPYEPPDSMAIMERMELSGVNML